jgi:hypothetical protein
MIKYLLKATNEYRVDTKDDADALHKQLEEEATNNGWVLSGWTEAYKTRKSQGEIVEEWYICKSTVIFNDAKEPEIALKNIDYNMFTESNVW